MKLSIITAVYNDRNIKNAIESVSKQTIFADIEFIIVDGCSTDGTEDEIDNNRKYISALIRESDSGIYNALNKGVCASTGDVIGFLHADDYYTNYSILEEVIRKMTEEKLDILYGNLRYVSRKHKKVVRNWRAGKYKKVKLKLGWMPPHPATFIKREIYDRIGLFNEGYRISSDYDFLLRSFSLADIQVGYLDKYIVEMRVGGASNKNIRNIYQKMSEDSVIIRKNNLSGFVTLLLKNLRKLNQFI